MGKQINFYMEEEVTEKILEYAFSKGFIVYGRLKENMKEVVIENFDFYVLNKEKFVHGFYFYKEKYGEIITKDVFRGSPVPQQEIDTYYSPVIEFSPSKVKYEENRISRGRVWVGTYYLEKDKDGNVITIYKDQSLIKDYEALVRFIKKFIKNREVQFEEHTLKVYITEKALELYENGMEIFY